tara:strand:- start:603 stop:1364 length:762 start_codon:yes stop_codon:yes gene_type:complete
MSSINIKTINQLKDNYSYLLYNHSGDASVIDPAESFPIIEYVKKNSLKIKDIFITHHHKDHTNGIEGIIKNFPEVNIHSPSSRIKNTRFVLNNNDEVETQINSFKIISTPGHTLDHIIYLDINNKILFCGDTLFRLGCGRVFEGTISEMHSSLQRINEIEDDLVIYCGHEYTLTNLNFLENVISEKRLYSHIRRKIQNDLSISGKSVPFNLAEEKLYNLFLNQESEIGALIKKELKLENFGLFKYLRDKKDSF